MELYLAFFFFFFICDFHEEVYYINVQQEAGSLGSMLEVKLSILEGVNKSMKVPDLIRSCIGICGSSQKQVQLLIAGKALLNRTT